MKVNERIRELRLANHMTQKTLAEKLGHKFQFIQQYELGKYAPACENLIQLADVFDVSIDYLVGRTDNPKRL